MAPAVVLDASDELPSFSSAKTALRKLLLAPPSIAAHPERLSEFAASHDRASTDIQMIDRLAAGLVSLPDSTYDLIILLTDTDGSRLESQKILDRPTLAHLVQALKGGGTLQSQDGAYAASEGPEKTEAVLAGLLPTARGMAKPEHTASLPVPLKLGRRKEAPMTTAAGVVEALPLHQPANPPGVGFVDFSDDLDEPVELDEGDDDELIDEDDLLTEEDLARPVMPRWFPMLTAPGISS